MVAANVLCFLDGVSHVFCPWVPIVGFSWEWQHFLPIGRIARAFQCLLPLKLKFVSAAVFQIIFHRRIVPRSGQKRFHFDVLAQRGNAIFRKSLWNPSGKVLFAIQGDLIYFTRISPFSLLLVPSLRSFVRLSFVFPLFFCVRCAAEARQGADETRFKRRF